MKRFSFLLLLLFSLPLHAEWSVADSKALSTANPNLEHFHRTLENGTKADLDVLLFNANQLAFRVMDNPENASALDEAMAGSSALAGVNGGFFHPDTTPLGLVVSDSKTLHPLEKAKLLSGLLVCTSQRISLLRIGELKSTKGIAQALQAGPFLVDHGKAVAGLNNQRAAARTVIATDGKGHFALVLCRVVTLAEMAHILTLPKLATEWKIERALNLDGGSSSAMWVRGEPPFYSADRKRVRNFLAIIPR